MRNIGELNGRRCPYILCVGRLVKQQDGTHKCSRCTTVVRNIQHYRRKHNNFSESTADVSSEILIHGLTKGKTKLSLVFSDEGCVSLKEAV